MKKFKNTLKGDTIILKRLTPTLKNAKIIFQEIQESYSHLAKWFPWVDETQRIEDTMKPPFH